MPKLTFIKLGGAVISNKDIPESVRQDVLGRLIKEIAKAREEKKLHLILGNGAGGFAHVPAARYKTMEGFIHPESRMGMAITQDSAARLNRLVVKTCLQTNLPAVTLAPSNTLVTNKRKAESVFLDVFEEYLKNELIPVVYGDVLADRTQGCTIWSTDSIFSFLARKLERKEWEVGEIIHVTEAEGVWKNAQHEIYSQITPAMSEEVKASMVDIKGFDVTGGMWHKIEESLSLTKLGIKTRIISGLVPNALYNTLVGKKNMGTLITSH